MRHKTKYETQSKLGDTKWTMRDKTNYERQTNYETQN